MGGRSATVNVFNDERFPVELGASVLSRLIGLGASVFVPENKILKRAAEDFGLQIGNLDVIHDDNDVDEIGMYAVRDFTLTTVGTVHNSYTHRVASQTHIGISSNSYFVTALLH